jgi:alpha-tubulin suppressor-like RCC1 family protein
MPHASTLHRQPHHLSTIAIITALLTALLLTLTGAPATATTDPLTSTDPPTTIDSPPWAWGSNALGQLGDGTTDNHSTAVRATGLDGVTVTATAAGWQHSLALLDDGTVRAWGANGDGQLGDGTTTDRSTPVAVSGLTGVTAIAAGDVHSLALLDDGTVRAWGFNGQGQLGDGSTTRSSTPVVVSDLTGVTAIAVGGFHSLALRGDGTVVAWGYNGDGQLGDGTTTSRTTAVAVSDLTGVTAIAAGHVHSLALLQGGTVRAWGANGVGQLGDGSTTDRSTPVAVSGLTGITAIAAREFHSLALRGDGTVVAWGWNGDGQLGDGSTTDRSTPVAVSDLTGVTAVAAGGYHSLALRGDGTMRAWGFNRDGQLGDGSTTRSSTPVVVSGLTDVTAIAAGGYHSLAVGAPRAPKPQPTSTTVTCDSAARYFTGHPHEPCTATVTGLGLIQILDVTYSGNVNVGTAKATASFPGTAKHGPSSGGATFAISPWSATGLLPSVFVPAPGTPPAPTADTIWNTAKGGATIPLRFDVHAGEVEKTSTAAVTGFTATKLSACAGAGAETDEVDFVTTGNTSLRYDDTGQQFVQNWKSPTVKSGEDCYRATVTFADRSTLSAFFRLRK